MKAKSKDSSKLINFEKHPTFDFNREKISEMEISLRKILASPITLPLNHQTIQNLIKFTKQVIKAIQAIKTQLKHYQNIQDNYNMIQSKLLNHEKIVNNLEELHAQRHKALFDQNKNMREYYEKAKKSLQESEEYARNQYEEIKKENSELRYRTEILKKQKENLEKIIEQKENMIKQLKDHKERFIKLTSTFIEEQPKYNEPALSSILCSSLGHRIIAYLPPTDITNLEHLNHCIRLYLRKSKKVQECLCKSIIKVKNRRIAYYHRHIDYFEKLYHKIPEEILQFTFYRYEILKQSVGTQIFNILNSSANLFEGKFTDVDDEQQKQKAKDQQKQLEMKQADASQTVIIGGVAINIQKEIKSVQEFNTQTPSNVLQVDEDIIREFLEDRKNSKEKINQEINLMYRKIQQSAQLYSADVESIGLFLKNILKNFSKVFVMSKNLYTEARNLQSLNTLILRQLSNWNKIQVEKSSQIQDLKAQLEAERKLRIFFTQKNIKSQQRALAEQNIKLGFESKLLKQTQKLDSVCKQKQELAAKLNDCLKDLKNLKSDNKQLRRAYQNGKQKYNKIIEELSVVKETILRMNIM